MKRFETFETSESADRFTVSSEKEDDEYVIRAHANGEPAGRATLELLTSAYWLVDDIMDEDEYGSLFPSDSFAYVRDVSVREQYRNAGVARLLLTECLSIAKEEGMDRVYLNACPMDSSTNMDRLVRMYESLGFRVLLRQKGNVPMLYNVPNT